MLLPNKLFSYNESVLSILPIVLRELADSKTPKELFVDLRHLVKNPLELLDALDCLYALGEIVLNEEEGVIVRCLER